MNVFEIALDVDKRDNKEVVYLRQGDVNGTTIKATLRDHDIPMDGGEYTAAFCMTLPDRKTYYWTEATYEEGVVSVVVDERIAAAVPGATNNAYFELYEGDELKYTTASFIVRIRPAASEVGQAAQSYDLRVEQIMEELREAIEKCVAPSVSVEDVDNTHVVTVVTPSGESTFTVVDGINGEKGEKGDKGDIGDPAQPGSIGMAQLSDEVRSRMATNRLIGTLSDERPSASDAFPAPVVGATVYGRSTQAKAPSKDNPSPIESVESVSIESDGDGWPIAIDLQEDELCSVPDYADELTIHEDGSVTITQRVGIVDLGTLTWAKTDTKTGGLSRYYSSDINDLVVAPKRNTNVASMMCDTYVPVSYTNTYNRVESGCIGISAAGTVAVYDEDYAGSMRTPAEFTERVSGVVMLYALAQPVIHDLGRVNLPTTSAPELTVTCNASFLLSYERDMHIVVETLERAIGA